MIIKASMRTIKALRMIIGRKERSPAPRMIAIQRCTRTPCLVTTVITWTTMILWTWTRILLWLPSGHGWLVERFLGFLGENYMWMGLKAPFAWAFLVRASLVAFTYKPEV